MISKLLDFVFDDAVTILNKQKFVILTMSLILTMLTTSFYYLFTTFSTISLLNKNLVKSETLKVVKQAYPEKLTVLKDYEHDPIGSLNEAGRFVANSSFALVFIHAGNWHYPSVEIGKRLRN